MYHTESDAAAAGAGLRDQPGRMFEFGLLTVDDELLLAAAIAAGEDDARARLIEANLRLIVCDVRHACERCRRGTTRRFAEGVRGPSSSSTAVPRRI